MSGQVIWITGLSASGKTTIAKALRQELQTLHPILLDGDELRAVLQVENDAYDYEGRKKLAFTYSRFAKMLSDQGYTVIVSTISLFHDLHEWNRKSFHKYLEVFLDINEEERRKRDPKGLYKAQSAGSISNMAGVGLSVEFPLSPDIHISEQESCEKIIQKIKLKLNNERVTK